jgi:hypothetical protein
LHTATLLPNGKVLVAGGFNSVSGFLASAELYDPASGTWTTTDSLTMARDSHTATLLPNGKVLVAGGLGTGGGVLNSAELYDTGLGFVRPDWQPQIATATSAATWKQPRADRFTFSGISQAPAELPDPSTNYP